jgi:hypothetical protein
MLLGVDSIYHYWKPTWASNQPPHFVKELFLTERDSSMLMVRLGGRGSTIPLGRGGFDIGRGGGLEGRGREETVGRVCACVSVFGCKN